MGRIYTAAFSGQSESTQMDIFEIVAGSADAVIIHEIGVSQGSEVQDAEEEMLLLLLKSGQTTSGSGGIGTGTGIEIEPAMVGDVASGATVEATNTTKASAGTIVTHYAWYWNVRVPFQMVWTPETRPVLAPARRATLELATTPADPITFGGYIVFEEIG